MPEDWEQKALSKPREYFDIKYVSKSNSMIITLFGATDLWEKLPSSAKTELSKKEINDSMFSKSDIADMFGLSSSSITERTINGIHYYVCVVHQTSEDFEGLTLELSHYIHIENGWVYWFEFSGENNSQGHSDFEKLLNSVEINKAKSNGSIIWIIALFVGGAIIAIVIILIQKNKNKRAITSNPVVDDSGSKQSQGVNGMKVFIWISTFVVGAFINTLIGYVTGIRFGSVLLFIIDFFIARKLCEVWDNRMPQHKAEVNHTKQEQPKMVGSSNNTTYPEANIQQSPAIHSEKKKDQTTCDINKLPSKTIVFKKTNNQPIVKSKPEKTTNNDDIAKTKIKYCRKCGSKIDDETIYCKRCGCKVKMDTKCQSCGAALDEDSIFCKKCGKKIE